MKTIDFAQEFLSNQDNKAIEQIEIKITLENGNVIKYLVNNEVVVDTVVCVRNSL